MQPPSSDPSSLEPETYFAPAARATAADVRAAAARAASCPIVDHLLEHHDGLLAVLNAQRQILAVNQHLLRLLGIDDPERVLGLRPGEAVECAHAQDHSGGCGTSRFCATCGAAIAITVCQQAGASAYRECVLDCTIDGKPTTLDLRVHATRLTVDEQQIVALYLHDVSTSKRRAAMERAFFHDVNNLLASLMGAIDLLADQLPRAEADAAAEARSLVRRISKELDIQRALSSAHPGPCRARPTEWAVAPALDELRRELSGHPAARSKRILVQSVPSDLTVRTDQDLAARILTNMVVNALEATPRQGTVELEARADGSERIFSVWNIGQIPDGVAMRIFQRYFSTKPGEARGVGTYSMRLFAEHVLGGSVDFTTSTRDGTRFSLRLPEDFFGAAG
ncbi:MAG: sensor histidine kinase [Deltaproteobacteria bacterium]|jgi:K+-sensing histidine kinase KdpD|nr:sensor histidine kinase [Deltaproteobacteria bacterium]MBW2530143.1 sensor histidine kinase [Deltaproteobacteria bacterium]